MDHAETNVRGRLPETRRADAGGFTLVEMLIVIGLIALLASLTMAVTRRFTEQSEIRSTKVTLRLLEASVREWEMTTERKILWWDPRDDPDWDAEDARVSTIRWLPADIKNAFGPHVHDPRTGEILEADVRMFHNVQKLVRDW